MRIPPKEKDTFWNFPQDVFVHYCKMFSASGKSQDNRITNHRNRVLVQHLLATGIMAPRLKYCLTEPQ